MKTVTLGLSDRAAANTRFVDAMHGGRFGNFISFEGPDILFKTLTLKRWEILQVLTGKEPVSIREAARLVGRDVKAVHGDITALLNVGILQRTEDYKISFPFDQVHVDFILVDPATDSHSSKVADAKHVQRRNKTGQYFHTHDSNGRILARRKVKTKGQGKKRA